MKVFFVLIFLQASFLQFAKSEESSLFFSANITTIPYGDTYPLFDTILNYYFVVFYILTFSFRITLLFLVVLALQKIQIFLSVDPGFMSLIYLIGSLFTIESVQVSFYSSKWIEKFYKKI